MVSNIVLKKSKENFHFKYINSFNVENLIKYILNIEFDKNQEEYDRRDSSFSGLLGGSRNVYDSVTPITLNKIDLNWKFGENLNSEKFYNDDLELLISPIIKYLEEKSEGSVAEVSFNKLKSGGVITGHYDHGDYYEYMRRYHIPLQTNNDVLFYIEKSIVNMPVGQCWEVNNAKYHSVQNYGNCDRIHLVVDIMPHFATKRD